MPNRGVAEQEEAQKRLDAMRKLGMYYAKNLAEDPQDGSIFDLEVFDAINDLKNKFGHSPSATD